MVHDPYIPPKPLFVIQVSSLHSSIIHSFTQSFIPLPAHPSHPCTKHVLCGWSLDEDLAPHRTERHKIK